MTATRELTAMASAWSCVTKSIVRPSSAFRRRSSPSSSSRSGASRPVSGSSSRTSGGSTTSARARLRRWRWPPERSVAGRSPRPSSRTSASVRSTRRPISAREGRRRRPSIWSGNATVSAAVMCGQSAGLWKTMPMPRRSAGTSTPGPCSTRPPTVTVPASGRSRPATQRSAVVLPLPDGPSRRRAARPRPR